MATDKRARKKEFRDLRQAEREAALRRRRAARLSAVGAVVLVVIGLALFAGGSDEPEDTPEPLGAALPEGCERLDLEADPQEYESPPDLSLEEGVDYRAVIHTSCGDIEMDLLEDKAEQNVANFVFLAREGFYDGLLWHRLERNFVIQTGDPNEQNGTPPDGPGYSIPDELPESEDEYVFGIVGMANSGPDSAGSQFFIIVHRGANDAIEPAGLQTLFTIFGEVAESSYEVIDRIQQVETMGGNDPVEAVKPEVPIHIESIDIIEA